VPLRCRRYWIAHRNSHGAAYPTEPGSDFEPAKQALPDRPVEHGGEVEPHEHARAEAGRGQRLNPRADRLGVLAGVELDAVRQSIFNHRCTLIYAAQPLAATKTGRHTRAVPRCSARSVCGDAGLAMGAPALARGTAKQESQRRCSKAMHAEHADGDWAAAPPVARCPQRVSVDIECVIDGLGAARKHQRVLRSSPSYICVGFFSVLWRHSHATHPFPAGCRKFVARRSDFED